MHTRFQFHNIRIGIDDEDVLQNIFQRIGRRKTLLKIENKTFGLLCEQGDADIEKSVFCDVLERIVSMRTNGQPKKELISLFATLTPFYYILEHLSAQSR